MYEVRPPIYKLRGNRRRLLVRDSTVTAVIRQPFQVPCKLVLYSYSPKYLKIISKRVPVSVPQSHTARYVARKEIEGSPAPIDRDKSRYVLDATTHLSLRVRSTSDSRYEIIIFNDTVSWQLFCDQIDWLANYL